MDFERVVRKRRMVRNFKKIRVPNQLVEKILEQAQHAPSAGFSQGWAYVVVTNENTKRRIGEIQGELDFYAGKRFHKFISEAPVVIVACTSEKLYHDRYRELDKLNANGTEIEWPVPFWYFDIGAACMLIFLATVNEGLSAAFTGVFRINEMKQLLNLPTHFQPVGVISIGYPDHDVKSPSLKRGRRPKQDVLHYESW